MPIYDELVEELGDVPTEVRLTAERTVRELEQVMDFRLRRAAAPSSPPQRPPGRTRTASPPWQV
jgi:hypothetical protein